MKKFLFILIMALAIPSANAVNLTFAESGLAVAFTDTDGADFFIGAFSDDDSTLVFDAATGVATATISGLATVNDPNNGNAELDQTTFDFVLTVTNVTEEASGNLVTTGTNSGTAQVTFNDVAGFGEISFSSDVYMFLNDDGGTNSNTLLDLTTSTGISAGAWLQSVGFQGIGDVLVNAVPDSTLGANGGDFSLKFGVEDATTEVPEPMTAALLGFGILGGAIRRNKSQ